MPSSALGTMVRIRRNAPEMENIALRADEGIGPYKDSAFNRKIPNARFDSSRIFVLIDLGEKMCYSIEEAGQNERSR